MHEQIIVLRLKITLEAKITKINCLPSCCIYVTQNISYSEGLFLHNTHFSAHLFWIAFNRRLIHSVFSLKTQLAIRSQRCLKRAVEVAWSYKLNDRLPTAAGAVYQMIGPTGGDIWWKSIKWKQSITSPYSLN